MAHGSRHAPANEERRALAARLEASGPYPIVEPSFLEQAETALSADGRTVSLAIPEIGPTWSTAITYSLRNDQGEAVDGEIHKWRRTLQPEPLAVPYVAPRPRETARADLSQGRAPSPQGGGPVRTRPGRLRPEFRAPRARGRNVLASS